MDPLSSSSSIPVMRSPNDLMANGPNSDNLAAAAIQTHPVDRMQRGTNTDSLDVDAIRRLYGSALAMRLTTERKNAMAVGGRLPGLDAHPNSNTVYETLTGQDVTINFGDYLNVSGLRPAGPGVGTSRDEIHSAMEAKLGL